MAGFLVFAPIYFVVKAGWWCVALPFKLIARAVKKQ